LEHWVLERQQEEGDERPEEEDDGNCVKKWQKQAI